MFVWILFCGFNGTGLKRSSLHEPSSLTTAATSTLRDFKSNISASDRLLFNKPTKWILCYSTRDVSFVTGVSVLRNVKEKSLFNDVGVAFTGEYPICPLTRQAQMHISELHLIYFHIWMRPETMGGQYGKNFIMILCHVGFTIFSEQCSQNNFPIIKTKPFKVTKIKKYGGYLGQSGRS